MIDQTLRELRESIVYLTTNCNSGAYPTEFETYDGAWESLWQSFEHLRGKLGEERYRQLVDMAAQAKAHYDEGYAAGSRSGARPPPGEPGSEHIKLGSRLMQDVEQVVKGKPPFAYPPERYRWPLSSI